MYGGGEREKKHFSSVDEGKPWVRVVLIKALICITAARSNISASVVVVVIRKSTWTYDVSDFLGAVAAKQKAKSPSSLLPWKYQKIGRSRSAKKIYTPHEHETLIESICQKHGGRKSSANRLSYL